MSLWRQQRRCCTYSFSDRLPGAESIKVNKIIGSADFSVLCRIIWRQTTINLLKKFLSYTKRTAILITINVTLFAVSTDVVKAFWSALHTVWTQPNHAISFCPISDYSDSFLQPHLNQSTLSSSRFALVSWSFPVSSTSSSITPSLFHYVGSKLTASCL